MPAGEGGTDKYGNILISPHGTAKDRALAHAHAHESVHSFDAPKTMNRLREVRADIGMAAYEKSALCKYIEEALAESYAQVMVNGVRALPDGLTFPIRNGYVTFGRVVKEGSGARASGRLLIAAGVLISRCRDHVSRAYARRRRDRLPVTSCNHCWQLPRPRGGGQQASELARAGPGFTDALAASRERAALRSDLRQTDNTRTAGKWRCSIVRSSKSLV